MIKFLIDPFGAFEKFYPALIPATIFFYDPVPRLYGFEISNRVVVLIFFISRVEKPGQVDRARC